MSTTGTPDQDETQAGELAGGSMSLIDHLTELRNRLLISMGILVVAFAVCFFFAEEIFGFLVTPLAEALGENRRLIATGLAETFFTYMKVAFFAGAFLSFPVIASQIWMFVAPGLYQHERRAFLPFLIATPVLFFAGGAMVYYVVFPLAINIFLGYEVTDLGGTGLALELEQRVSEYLSLIMKLIFAFGLAFELPVLLTLLARAGLVSSQSLVKFRRYGIVIIFAAAALITPPDPFTQLLLALPLLLLYEVSVLLARYVERRRAQREAEEDAKYGLDRSRDGDGADTDTDDDNTDDEPEKGRTNPDPVR